MKRHRRHRLAGRRSAGVFPFRPLALAVSILLPCVVSPGSLEAASPIENSVGNLNAHLQVHSAAVGRANSPAQTGGAHTHNQVLNFARALLNLRLDLQVPDEPTGGNTPGVRNAGGGYGGDLTTDLFVQQQISIDNWAPGGPNNSFNDRGTLIAQDGSVVITPTSSYQIGNFNLQTAAINGRYTYVNDIDAPHGAGVHSPFDLTSSASGSADTTTDTSEVRVDLQWVGAYDHPAEAYDGPPGGGYPAPIGALDFFTFDIVGNAAAQYFNPTGLGGSNQQPGLPDLPELPSLPDFGDQPLPNELTGLNPYAPSRTNTNNQPYNPYNPPRYTDPDYNPYNPNTHTDPSYNPYNPTSYNSNNPYLASNPYNARGAPDNSALLAALGGSASNVDNQSQFDLSWMTEIEQAQGVQHYQDYGSFSSATSAAFRGIVRPLQLTAVNQQDLASYIAATGNIPSTIATQVNVLEGTPGGVTSFASLDTYDERRNPANQQPPGFQGQPAGNPLGYDTYAGGNQGSNASRVASYQGTGTTPAEFGGAPTPNPLGYNTGPLFAANNPGGNRIGSFDTANSYDDNTQGSLLSGASGYQSPAGDVLSYGGATGYDGYDSSAAREQKQAEIDAALDEERKEVAAIEEQERLERNLKAMESLTLQALELAKRDTSPAESPTRERKPTNTKIVEVAPGVYKTIQDDPIEEVAPGEYADKEKYDPTFDVPDDIEEKYREQQERLAQSDPSTAEEPGTDESVKDGGYQFDDPYQDSNAPGNQFTPREKLLDYYGNEIAASGWEEYLDTPASEFASLPPEVRNSDEFQKWKLYEYVLNNPDASPEQIGNFYRGLTGAEYDSDFADTWLWKTAVDAKENGVAWDAAWKGVKGSLSDIRAQLESLTVIGQSKQIIDHAKLVLMPEEERKKYLDSMFAPYEKILELLSLDSEERNQEINRLLNVLKQDIVENPEKYTELGVRTGLTSIFDLVSGAAVTRYVEAQGLKGSANTPDADDRPLTKLSSDGPDSAPSDQKKTTLADGGVESDSGTGSKPINDGSNGPEVGDKIGEGKTSDVYKGEDGTVVKVLKPNYGDDAFNRMIESYEYIDGYDDIPKVEILSHKNDASGRQLIIEDLNSPKWQANGKNAYLLEDGHVVTNAEAAAVQELGQKLLDKGLMWADPNKGNVFFFKDSNGKLTAGIIDHDFIAPTDKLRQSAMPGSDMPQSVVDTSSQFQAVMGTPELVEPYIKWISSGTPESARAFYSAWIEAKLGRLQ